MKDNKDNLELIIKYEKSEKLINLPNNFDDLLEQVISIFDIPKEKKPFLIMSFKNISGNIIKISSSEEFSSFLSKFVCKEISNIIYISIQQPIIKEFQNYSEDINNKYEEEEEIEEEMESEDKNDLFLRQGHIFSKNKKMNSEIFGGETNNINKILNESIEGEIIEENNNNDNIFSNEIVKSVLPPMTSFPSYCNMCQKFPIIKIMYYCDECKLYFCEDCEKSLGYHHRHCYYKIRNKEQYQEIINMEIKSDDIIKENKNKKGRMDKLKKKKETFNGIFNSLFGFIKDSNNNINKNEKNDEDNNSINNKNKE